MVINNIIKYSFYISNRISQKYRILYSKWISALFLSSGKKVYFDKISLLIGSKYIKIGDCTCFGKDLYLTAWNKDHVKKTLIQIGDNCSFGAYNHITASNKVHIGNHVLTGKWVTITDNSHGTTNQDSLSIPPTIRPIVSKGPVIIADNVWIGDKATILPNVIIGKGAVIAANSVVTKDVPPYSVAAGIPAQIIKQNR